MQALVLLEMSVCTSVCLSHSGIVSILIKLLRHDLFTDGEPFSLEDSSFCQYQVHPEIRNGSITSSEEIRVE